MKKMGMLVLLILFGIQAPAAFAATAVEGKIVLAQGSDPRTLNPLMVSTAYEVSAIRQVYEKLVDFDRETRTFKPFLAESWKWLDEKTLELKIRKGIKFTNGEEVNADAAVLSLSEWFKVKEFFEMTGNFEKVVKVDDFTVRISCKRIISPTINLSRFARACYVIPPKYYQELGPDKFGLKPLGTGPFIFKEWVKDDRITFEANPDYRGSSGPAPKFKTFVMRPIPEPAARVAALEAGDVDIATDIPYGSIPRLNQNKDITVVEVPGMRVMGLRMDCRYGVSDITKNQKVRQALMYAIDRQAIIKSVLGGHAVELSQIILPYDFGYVDDLKPTPYDPAKAKQLLAEAGYPDGFKVPIMSPSGRYIMDKELTQAIAAQLEKVGVKTDIQIMETGAFLDRVIKGKGGPLLYIGTLTGTGHAIDRMQMNSCRYAPSYKCNPEFEALLEKAETTMDEKEQKEVIKQLVLQDLNDPGRVPLWATNDVYGVRKTIQDWKPNPDQEMRLFGVGLSK